MTVLAYDGTVLGLYCAVLGLYRPVLGLYWALLALQHSAINESTCMSMQVYFPYIFPIDENHERNRDGKFFFIIY